MPRNPKRLCEKNRAPTRMMFDQALVDWDLPGSLNRCQNICNTCQNNDNNPAHSRYHIPSYSIIFHPTPAYSILHHIPSSCIIFHPLKTRLHATITMTITVWHCLPWWYYIHQASAIKILEFGTFARHEVMKFQCVKISTKHVACAINSPFLQTFVCAKGKCVIENG